MNPFTTSEARTVSPMNTPNSIKRCDNAPRRPNPIESLLLKSRDWQRRTRSVACLILALWLCTWVIPSATGAPGDLDPAYDPGVRPSKIVLQPDGKALIIGSFTEVQGVARNQIARLNPDGSLDDSFVPGSLAAVGLLFSYSAVASFALQPDDRVIIVAEDWAVRLNPDGSVDPSFTPYTEFDNGVSGVALLSNGKVLARDVYGIARLNSDGTPDGGYIVASFMNISLMEAQPDETVLVGGGPPFSAGMIIRDTDGN
jgi:uncharacterized delta-60 repeat protein